MQTDAKRFIRTEHQGFPARPQRPPENGSLSLDSAGCLVLDRAECLRLLSGGGLGRVAINVGALPVIRPVRFALQGERIVLRVAPGGTLDRATRTAVVAFEADGPATEVGGEWSVTVTGIARQLPDGPETEQAEQLALPHWPAERPHRFVTISTEHLSGRRALGTALRVAAREDNGEPDDARRHRAHDPDHGEHREVRDDQTRHRLNPASLRTREVSISSCSSWVRRAD
jgi:nitroimidazol reductase NimA-like FMN-containing flavoprotein (pyridoxamine 5'-phosphate oxidase superfamily)